MRTTDTLNTRYLLRPIFLSLILFPLTLSCGGTESNQPLDLQIDQLIEENQYVEALDLVEGNEGEIENPELQREKIHLNYGLHLMTTFDESEMRTRMNEAMRQFIEVIRINPDNQVAREQINQILMVYDTIPDREPEPDVTESLNELGWNR
ncbi:MAG: hypothetical protein ACQER4_00540 [Bacteroidota bacterium]